MVELAVTPSQRSWDASQRRYWSSLASNYDSLYESAWSQAENDWVAERLAFLRGRRSPRILDLGCGTGLGAELARRWTDLEGYTGVDISPTMTALTTARYQVDTRVGSMDDLQWVPDESVDAVIALFSSISFAASVPTLLAEVARVLRPSGRAYLSALGRDFSAQPAETSFKTRGWRSHRACVPAHRFRPHHLSEAAHAVGLVDVQVTGMNSLAGVLEAPRLWWVGAAIAARWPSSSHLLELTCAAPRPANRQE